MKPFEKIIGYKSIVTELEKIIDIMTNTEKYSKLGVSVPRGLLLHGTPGVGKTLMANSFIKASGRKTYVCRKNKPNGAFVKEIKKKFDEAAQNAPSIVFLDDMDKFANEDERHRNAEEFVTVQSCIDQVKGKEVFVLATANDLDALPRSLLRVGRFDRNIEVCVPRGKDAEDIIRHYLSKKKFVGDVDIASIAKIMDGESCAMLETVINEAGMNAGYLGKEQIETEDIARACMRIIFRAPESLEGYTEKQIARIACHEAGHAVVSEVLEPGSVNIISVCKHSGDMGGVTSCNQSEDYWYDKAYMENRIVTLLGGKAATEITFGEVDVGAYEDLRRAYAVADRFVDEYCSYGFDKFSRYNSSDVMDERSAQFMCAEMERYFWRAKQIVAQHRKFLDALARELAQKQTLFAKDIAAIRKQAEG